jgi:putative ABC transport system substrate-binding protein
VKKFVALLLLLLLGLPHLAAADGPFRIFMILYRGETDVERGFRDYLRDHHIAAEISVRNIDHDMKRLPGLIAEAKQVHPDLVYTWGTGVTVGVVGEYDRVSAKDNITDIPVLFTMVASPEGARIMRNRQSSERNVTGVSHIVPLDSQIKAIRAYRPLMRLAVIYNTTEANSVVNVRELRQLSKTMNFDLIEQPIPLNAAGAPRADTLPDLVAKVAEREPQFLYIGPDTFVGDNRDVITNEGIKHRLPTFSATELEVRTSNAMFGLVTTYYNLGRLAGYKAEEILVDKKAPRDIPIETLQRFSYLVKMPVARALGLYPPMSLLQYAEIIE